MGDNMQWNRICPSEVGIPEEKINEFLNELEKHNVELDSLMMISKGSLIYENYFKGWNAEKNHRMYSVGKSFTAIAIGLLKEEGKLSLEDPICDYFKDKLPKNGVHPYIAEMKIKHLLTMTTAHKSTTYKLYDGDWVESFFCVEPDYHPGTIFSYDTSATHVLSALVARLSGKDLFTYLREKVLDAIGFSKTATWDKDDAGIVRGGDGLSCTTRDLAAVATLCMNQGIYEGKQLIPKEYLKEMTTALVSTAHYEAYDEQFGYGYQIWGNRDGGFTFYGIGGQLAACYPKHDFILITNADLVERSKDIKYIHQAFYDVIFPLLN